MDKICIGLIGFGTVGTGVVRLLKENRDIIKARLGAELVLRRIADLDLERDRGVRVEPELLVRDASVVLEDPDISIVVELVGGEEPARSFILRALESGKHVVTANKALLASRGNEIFEAAQRNRVDVAFEGSVAGGIPIIRCLKEGLAANAIVRMQGIVNGTSNYILTEMTERGEDFEAVLAEAQRMGYAEADPTLDVEGIDAAHKLSILVALAYGAQIQLDGIYVEGISRIEPLDISFALELGYKIKLLALSKKDGEELEARVHPTMVPMGSPMSTVDGVYNALHIEGDAVGSTFFYGMGAGMMPTASAVVSDLMELARNIIKGISQRVPSLSYQWGELRRPRIRPMEEVVTNYYLRFSALDRPGVLAAISGILAKYGISILSVVQKGRRVAGGEVPIVMMTHEAKEAGIRKALEEIEALPVTVGKTQLIRVEDENLRDRNL
jgi:homoserine dehydrogenase